LGLPRVLDFKFLEGLIDCDEVKIAFCAKIKSFIQWQSYRCRTASFVARARYSISDQNAAHGARRKCNNVRFVAPGMIRPFEHTQERFVQQGRRLQGVTRPLTPQIFRSQAAKLFIRRNRQLNGICAMA
jgi:hypothetical protein